MRSSHTNMNNKHVSTLLISPPLDFLMWLSPPVHPRLMSTRQFTTWSHSAPVYNHTPPDRSAPNTPNSTMSRPLTPPRSENEGSSSGAHTNMNDDESAQRRRQLLEDLRVLSSLGLNKELELPQLVCVGSQSAGKSSLIETLCRITLPRSSGTCTRCPIECRSKYVKQPWSGRVFLRLLPENDDQSDAREIPFGDVITDPSEMEMRIGQAQLAVLHPQVDPSTFLRVNSLRYKGTVGSGFSNNSVVVDLAGEGLADLNFVDLPGIIVNVGEGEDPGQIPLVADMVRRYISKRSTIILLVISCHADYENQGAGLIAKECDPDGERTVGVLTKPDRIESPEDADPWVAMVLGNSNRLANGWYCVKQLDGKQRKDNLTWDQARNLELDFFRTTKPWSDVPSVKRANLGSQNLALQLGNVLSIALEKRFAEIRVEIDRLLRENVKELSQYPEPPNKQPADFIIDLLEKFYEDVRIQLVGGDPDDADGVIQRIREHSLQFRKRIQEAAPVFIPGPENGTSRNSRSPTDQPKEELVPKDEEWLRSSAVGNEWTTLEVKRRAGGGILRETSDFCSFAPTKWYMTQVVNKWEICALDLLETATMIFWDALVELVRKHFSVYSGGLFALVSEITQQLLDECKKRTTEQLKYLSEQEKHPRTFHEMHYQELLLGFQQFYHEKIDADGAVMVTMGRTRALYEFAFRRYTDNVPMTIDLHFVRTFGRRLHSSITTALSISRDEAELGELLRISDPVAAQREALEEKGRRLRAARLRLST
ncbi:Interferon-induced GTP-binding protein Mx1 [Ceratobasidium theobromae]|uniref:Interferon-induced GTP-binding protein Mx1 n=1 Tax=Ceratobasidium theobromae TaxID=1582974 RepID=A0A5N5QCT7_9AGAM|nr:Interferon-induced GTP-binding protein Mx1 [Ceratobasidium theobromae]